MQRATKAKIKISHYDDEKQKFLDFVLKQYVDNGIKDLDDKRLKDLLMVQYKEIEDAKNKIGDMKTIRDTFIGFQKYLYEEEIEDAIEYEDLMVAEPVPEYN